MRPSSFIFSDNQYFHQHFGASAAGGAAVPSGPAVQSRVRGAAAALPREPGGVQLSHAGHIRTPSEHVTACTSACPLLSAPTRSSACSDLLFSTFTHSFYFLLLVLRDVRRVFADSLTPSLHLCRRKWEVTDNNRRRAPGWSTRPRWPFRWVIAAQTF